MSYLVLLHRSPSFNCPAFLPISLPQKLLSAFYTLFLAISFPYPRAPTFSTHGGISSSNPAQSWHQLCLICISHQLPTRGIKPASCGEIWLCIRLLLISSSLDCTESAKLIPFCHPGTLCLRLLYFIFGLPRNLSNHFPRFKCPLRDWSLRTITVIRWRRIDFRLHHLGDIHCSFDLPVAHHTTLVPPRGPLIIRLWSVI